MGALDPALEAVAALYRRVGALLDRRRPRCEMSGRCCDFARQEHQLWASSLELEYARQAAGGVVPQAPAGQCPWWRQGLCEAREGRPLGCRLYFCDPSWTIEMEAVYEEFHGQLRQLHERYGRSYGYGPFVDAVRVLEARPGRGGGGR